MIEIQLNKKYSSDFTFEVVATISLPKIIGIQGDSGSGKTTFFRMLSGLTQPDSGYIKVKETFWLNTKENKNYKPQQRSCSYLFQEGLLFPHLTLFENIQFANNTLSTTDILEWLAAVDLVSQKDQYPRSLSGGQQKRGALIVSLVVKSKIILLDEPFAALDSKVQKKVFNLIQKVYKEHEATIFIASHKHEILNDLCSHVFQINNNSLILEV